MIWNFGLWIRTLFPYQWPPNTIVHWYPFVCFVLLLQPSTYALTDAYMKTFTSQHGMHRASTTCIVMIDVVLSFRWVRQHKPTWIIHATLDYIPDVIYCQLGANVRMAPLGWAQNSLCVPRLPHHHSKQEHCTQQPLSDLRSFRLLFFAKFLMISCHCPSYLHSRTKARMHRQRQHVQ